jgi:type II restriction/modification system DNA methylase subunit YeeA
VYGADTLSENLSFIAETLYPKVSGTARDKIRRYFLNDFYKDHVKIYQKKPIYWQFDSGKQGGFKALVYLHRYDKYTVGRVRMEYLHPLQRKYEAEIERLNALANLPETSAREKSMGQKRVEVLRKKIVECRNYDQIIAHLAVQNIELDLDDGVTINYAKFQGVEIAQGDGRLPVKMDLLGRI